MGEKSSKEQKSLQKHREKQEKQIEKKKKGRDKEKVNTVFEYFMNIRSNELVVVDCSAIDCWSYFIGFTSPFLAV